MQRREFIAGLGAAAWPAALRAQPVLKGARIGYLTFRVPTPADDAFLRGLREFNWIEGRNILIERRYPAGDTNLLKSYAAELVRLKLDVIVSVAGAATHAVKAANGSIPVVFLAAGDPVGEGFVESIPRPGGIVTGVSFDAGPDITAKQVQLLTKLLPTASHVAVLWNAASGYLLTYWNAAHAAEPALRVKLDPIQVRNPDELDGAFERIANARAEALIVLSDAFATFHRARLATLAARHGLPTIYGHSQFVEAGGLISYGPSLNDVYRLGAGYVDKILNGAKPVDLPVMQPTKYELVINLQTAKGLGLTIPETLLATADEVIQ
jgi:putative tryptophan/tyrosine transport system substrate-binding protein